MFYSFLNFSAFLSLDLGSGMASQGLGLGLGLELLNPTLVSTALYSVVSILCRLESIYMAFKMLTKSSICLRELF